MADEERDVIEILEQDHREVEQISRSSSSSVTRSPRGCSSTCRSRRRSALRRPSTRARRQTNRPEEAARELQHARSALGKLKVPTDLERTDALLARAHAESPDRGSTSGSAVRQGHGSGPIAP